LTDNYRVFRNIIFSISIFLTIVAVDLNNIFYDIFTQPETLEDIVVVAVPKPQEETAITEPQPQQPVVDQEAIICLATNIYHEARGESLTGQIAVAHVTYNRMKSRRFPDKICDVVYQAVYSTWWYEHHGRLVPVRFRCQFSWFCDGKSDLIDTESRSWKNAKGIAWEVLYNEMPDPTNGSTHYFNHHLVNPYWAAELTYVATIQNHSFYIH